MRTPDKYRLKIWTATCPENITDLWTGQDTPPLGVSKCPDVQTKVSRFYMSRFKKAA